MMFYKYETFCYANRDPINVLQLNGYTDSCIYKVSGKELYLYSWGFDEGIRSKWTIRVN